MTNRLEITSLTVGYPKKVVLDDVNLKVYDNDFIGIIGPNGGGKTSLLKAILGSLKPIKGKVLVNIKNIGYLPQFNPNDKLFPISVKEVVLSGLMTKKGIFGIYTRKDKQLSVSIMDKMGIADIQNNMVGELSGGQLQRVYLCRAIVSSPKLLLLDEPSTFIDSTYEKNLFYLLQEMNKKMAILMVSHDIGTISSYVKTIACVNKKLHYHKSNIITQKQLEAYNCPIQVIKHGDIPHTVLKKHS